MKKIVLLLIFCCSLFLLSGCVTEKPEEKNDTKKTSIASLTKMMTTLVAIENIDDLEKVIEGVEDATVK